MNNENTSEINDLIDNVAIAGILGIKTNGISRLCCDKFKTARKIDGRWHASLAEVRKYKETRGRGRRPW